MLGNKPTTVPAQKLPPPLSWGEEGDGERETEKERERGGGREREKEGGGRRGGRDENC